MDMGVELLRRMQQEQNGRGRFARVCFLNTKTVTEMAELLCYGTSSVTERPDENETGSSGTTTGRAATKAVGGACAVVPCGEEPCQTSLAPERGSCFMYSLFFSK